VRVACWAAGAAEISCHFAIRHQVFVEEQGVMVFTDVDAHDGDPATIHVVAAKGTQMAGTVRLYPTDDDGRWKGDRLAVLPAYRASLVGPSLVRFAVATAAAAGGVVMDASVQVPNTKFFERLGWHRSGTISRYYGLPHQPMAIGLRGVPAARTEHPGVTELHLPTDRFDHSPLLVAS